MKYDFTGPNQIYDFFLFLYISTLKLKNVLVSPKFNVLGPEDRCSQWGLLLKVKFSNFNAFSFQLKKFNYWDRRNIVLYKSTHRRRKTCFCYGQNVNKIFKLLISIVNDVYMILAGILMEEFNNCGDKKLQKLKKLFKNAKNEKNIEM